MLNQWGYFIFIDTFMAPWDYSDFHFYLFVHPGHLPVRAIGHIFVNFCLLLKRNNRKQSGSSQLFSVCNLFISERSSEKNLLRPRFALALLTQWKTMDCNNNCRPSGQWTVKEQLLGVQPLKSLFWHTLQS